VSLLPGAGAGVRDTAVSRANPVAKLVAASALALALLLTVDVVTAATALALELLVLPVCGLSAGPLARRALLLVVAAVPAAVATALFAEDAGRTLLEASVLEVSTGSLTAGAAIGLRILAVGLPGVVLLASTDPTDLGDALAQVAHLPHRFVLGALAGLRLVDVLAEEWQTLGLARRARGLGDDGLVGRVRVAAGRAFALLVLSVRRATVLATAMEARGFGGSRRTWARPSRLRPADALVVAGGAGIAAAATAAGLAAGTWRLLLT
jgi:energy-coupling factor transport system permease protein